MKEATKRSTYSEFVKLSPEERLYQSELLRKLKPTMIPVIISPFQKHLQDIPNCKYTLAYVGSCSRRILFFMFSFPKSETILPKIRQ